MRQLQSRYISRPPKLRSGYKFYPSREKGNAETDYASYVICRWHFDTYQAFRDWIPTIGTCTLQREIVVVWFDLLLSAQENSFDLGSGIAGWNWHPQLLMTLGVEYWEKSAKWRRILQNQDELWTEEIKRKCRHSEIYKKGRRIALLGHVIRMDDKRTPKRIFICCWPCILVIFDFLFPT